MSQRDAIRCYGSTGNHFNNNTKCPDSDSCCNTAQQCRPDRLCVSDKDPDILVRAPCSVYPWSNNCAKVCIEEDSSGFLPRVNICRDGSYCCVKDTTCCVDKRGFFLNDDGTIKARANSTISDTTSIIPTTTTTLPTTALDNTSTGLNTKAPTNAPTDPPAPTASGEPQPAASGGISQPAKFGVGFGVAFGGLLVLFIAYFAWRRRHRNNRLQLNPAAYPTYGQKNKAGDLPVELPTPQQVPLSELEGYYSESNRR
ncbi:hypothetical protein AJ78_04159 [Emergomyces pasteurianus Ep9510]|uniref:Mid2 domain-containing protein n=1 Tax=Emergomyces pasteurianus Ep9510 TaxID=1447872 RepID=A0A1J9PHW4_9EURO|nr:hypothetical protein AJ78_04159 [Emergomyces pasteurianus Ep9510]